MNHKKLTVILLTLLVLTFFFLGMNAYQQRVKNSQAQKVSEQNERLVRPHAKVFGSTSAPVTIVEFFDPACETCRAFYPIVKDILRQYPQDVRLVLRNAPFHPGSDGIATLLEASKRQGLYQTLLEALFVEQQVWADHENPKFDVVERLAVQAGLDLAKAKSDAQLPEVQAALKQDIEDLTALEVTKTPTFFVNGRGLPSFGESQLREMVADAVAQAKSQREK